MAWGLIAGSQLSGLPLFYGSYPITPASEILHEMVRHRNFGVKTFQAEDEIAAAGAALGAAFAGSLAITGTSGPGLSLKGETISLAIITELPMIIVDVQRGGPSTGLPTKPEQSDLFWPCGVATASPRSPSWRPRRRPTPSRWRSRHAASPSST